MQLKELPFMPVPSIDEWYFSARQIVAAYLLSIVLTNMDKR
jgi:hypothetical protein